MDRVAGGFDGHIKLAKRGESRRILGKSFFELTRKLDRFVSITARREREWNAADGVFEETVVYKFRQFGDRAAEIFHRAFEIVLAERGLAQLRPACDRGFPRPLRLP